MRGRRFPLHGLFLVLLALMVQLGSAAMVPRNQAVAVAGALCHSDDDTGGTPPQTPPHCLVCPLCSVPHARMVALLPPGIGIVPPSNTVVIRTELPPPSTAPPASHWLPTHPRAPPTLS